MDALYFKIKKMQKTLQKEKINQTIENENDELKKLYTEINELNSMNNDILTNLVNQNEKVDKITSNVNLTELNIEEGKKDLEKSYNYYSVGLILTGSILGAAVGGPAGLYIGSHITTGIIGLGTGLGVGAYLGYKTQKISENINLKKN
jgi:hypothetical protein